MLTLDFTSLTIDLLGRMSSWHRYKHALKDEPLPAALVDMDALDANIETILAPVRARGKKLRIATKSIRSVDIIRHIAKRAGELASGVMTYTASETAFLAEQGFTDLMLAYPTASSRDADLLALANTRAVASAMVDCDGHLPILSAAAKRAGVTIPVAIDVDMSWRPAGLHVGVHRSPVRSAEEVVRLAERISSTENLRFDGVMGYEAQIAGVTDQSPFSPWMNPGKRWMKRFSRSSVEDMRARVASMLAGAGLAPRVFNGGGTGSIHWSTTESVLTEVTAGSGFFASHLFDHYRDVKLRAAAGFALQVVRRPSRDVVTCHGGGYVASGEAGPDRLPAPWLPDGMQLLPLEGAGEVQTPVRIPHGISVELGEPLFFRHAKAGELAEHFNQFLLVRGDRIESRVDTYRGMGRCFLG